MMEAEKQTLLERPPSKAIVQSLLLAGLVTALLIWIADLVFSDAAASTRIIYNGLKGPFEFGLDPFKQRSAG